MTSKNGRPGVQSTKGDSEKFAPALLHLRGTAYGLLIHGLPMAELAASISAPERWSDGQSEL